MCLGIPGQLKEISSVNMHLARVDVSGVTRIVNIGLLEDETLVPGEKPSMKSWRVAIYMWLASNALSPARFYHLPPGRVVELGTQVSI